MAKNLVKIWKIKLTFLTSRVLRYMCCRQHGVWGLLLQTSWWQSFYELIFDFSENLNVSTNPAFQLTPLSPSLISILERL